MPVPSTDYRIRESSTEFSLAQASLRPLYSTTEQRWQLQGLAFRLQKVDEMAALEVFRKKIVPSVEEM